MVFFDCKSLLTHCALFSYSYIDRNTNLDHHYCVVFIALKLLSINSCKSSGGLSQCSAEKRALECPYFLLIFLLSLGVTNNSSLKTANILYPRFSITSRVFSI